MKPIDYMVEVARSIEQDATDEVGFTPLIDYLITGGTDPKTLHGKNEDAFYSEYVSALKWGGPASLSICRPTPRTRKPSSVTAPPVSTVITPTWKCGT